MKSATRRIESYQNHLKQRRFHCARRGRFGTWRPASGGRGGPDAARTCPGRAPDAAGPVPDGRRTPPDAAGRKLKSRRTGAGRAPDGRRTPPDAS